MRLVPLFRLCQPLCHTISDDSSDQRTYDSMRPTVGIPEPLPSHATDNYHRVRPGSCRTAIPVPTWHVMVTQNSGLSFRCNLDCSHHRCIRERYIGDQNNVDCPYSICGFSSTVVRRPLPSSNRIGYSDCRKTFDPDSPRRCSRFHQLLDRNCRHQANCFPLQSKRSRKPSQVTSRMIRLMDSPPRR